MFVSIFRSEELMLRSGPALDTIDVCDGTGAPKSRGRARGVKIRTSSTLSCQTVQIVSYADGWWRGGGT